MGGHSPVFRTPIRGKANLIGAVLCLAALGGAGPAAASQQAIDAGRAWLHQSVAQDGAWRSARDPRGVRSTALALRALGDAAPAASRPWLSAQSPTSLEEAWDAALALRGALPDVFLAPVDRQRTAPGTWSSAAGLAPGAYHTALGLLTPIFAERAPGADAVPGAAYLESVQRLDGSWPIGAKGQETATVTAAAALALALTDPGGASEAIALGRSWLVGEQNAGGGWGVGGSTPGSTAEVLAALRWLGCPPQDESEAAAYLVAAQLPDGSWEGDPWTTALAVTALLPAGLPDLAFAVGGPGPRGDAVTGDLWALSAAVLNRGSFTAAPVAVRLSLADTSGLEVYAEERSFDALTPGESVTAAFSVDTTPLAGSYTWTVSLDPGGLVAEGDEANNVATGTLSVGGWRNLVLLPEALAVFTWDGLLELDPHNLAVGTDVLVRVRIRCDGTSASPPVTVFMFRGDPAAGFLEGAREEPGLAPDEVRDLYLPWTVTQPTGPEVLALELDHHGQVAQTDRVDDRGDLAVTITAADAQPPEPPGAVMARIESKDRVVVSWSPSPSADVVGYRVFRDGVPINSPDLAPDSVASASGSYNLRDYLPPEYRAIAAFDPPNLNDGDPETSWWSVMYPALDWEPEDCYVQFALPGTRSVRGVIIQWYNFDRGAEKFRVQYWDGAAWADAALVDDNILDRSVVIFPGPVVTGKVRILLERGITASYIAIREVSILEGGPGRLVTGTTFDDATVAGLPATYTVAAVDAAGNESRPSEPFRLEDVNPPVVVVTDPSAGSRVGPEVFIQGTVTDDFLQGYAVDWGRGSAPTEWFRAGQRAEPVVDGSLLTWHPPGGLSEECTIRVSAFDAGGVGNIREAQVPVVVDTTPPAEPTGLAWSVAGDDVTLVWAANAEPDVAGYRVTVNGDVGVDDVTAEGAASASGSYGNAYVSYLPGNAVDGDGGSFWRPPDDAYPSWWALEFPAPKLLRRVHLSWGYPFVPRRFRVETRGVDGSWRERWRTDDNVEPDNQIDFETAAPAAAVRVVFVEARILGSGGASAPFHVVDPPAPYPVLAEARVFSEDLLTAPLFQTALKESREYGLTVQAVDDLGNLSTPSQAAVVDLRGPRVRIISPTAGEQLGRAVAVRGLVEDRYLKDWVLEVGSVGPNGEPPAYWEEIHRSLATVRWGGMLTVWHPTFRKGPHALRLTARDQAGFTTQTEVGFTLDAMPPEPPSNLAAAEAAGQVSLSWSPSLLEADGGDACADLAGYRVYKNEIPLTVKDVSYLARVTAPTFNSCEQGVPANMVDGLAQSSWEPIPFATSAEIVLDLPQPYDLGTVVVDWGSSDWSWGRDYGIDLYDQAAGAWVRVAEAADSLVPRSEHAFAAFVTDRVRISLTRGWTQFSLGAIAEVNLLRAGSADLVGATTYLEEVPGEGEAAYRVTAVDAWGNESVKSNRVRLDRSPPRVAIISPEAGDLHARAGECVPIMGTIDDPLLREYRLEVGAGDPPLAWTTLAHYRGEITPILTPTALRYWCVPAKVEGPYTIRLSALDEGDRRAEASVVVHVDTKPPEAPAGLVALLEGGNVRLDWQDVVAADLAGYHVYRNGRRLDLAQVAVNGDAWASSFVPSSWGGMPWHANDGSVYSYWKGAALQIPAWHRLMFDGFYPVERIAVDWYPWNLARDFRLQSWDRATASWSDLKIEQDWDANPYEWTLPAPVRLEGLRLYLTRGVDETGFAIREVQVFRGPGAETPAVATFLDDAIGDLEYTYRVTAFDAFGNESTPSNEFQLDDLAPRVVLLEPAAGRRVGAHVELTGTVADRRLLDYRVEVAEGASGGAWTEVGVWENPVDDNVLAVWDPPAGKEGPWRLRIVARDLVGHSTVVERAIQLDTAPPPTPGNLAGLALGADAVRLDWTAVTASDLATYRVYRHDRLLNDPVVTPWGTATASYAKEAAGRAIDGDMRTFWYAAGAPYSWQEDFPSPVSVSTVDIRWGAPPRDYEFQVLVGGVWRTVLMVWANAFAHRIHTIPVPEAGSGFRILITGPDRDREGRELATTLVELEVRDDSRALPILDPWYVDAGLPEIGWTYKVSAMDDLGNESAPTSPITVDSAPPVVSIEAPLAGQVVSAAFDVLGAVEDSNLRSWRLKGGAGGAPAFWEEIAYGADAVPGPGAKLARWHPPEDFAGAYTLLLVAEDRAGQVAEVRRTVTVATLPPAPPPDLQAAVGADGSVRLSWGAPFGSEIVGYYVYRNGQRLNKTNLASLGAPSASTSYWGRYPAEWAIDGIEESFWLPEPFLYPAWIAVDFPQTVSINGVNASWFESVLQERYHAIDYQIQVREAGDWKTVVYVENNEKPLRADHFAKAVSTDGVRLLITRGYDKDFPCVLRELQVLSATSSDLVVGTSYVDAGLPLVEGVYTVTAVDVHGYESPPSTVVVDAAPPRLAVGYPLEGDRVPRWFTVLGSVVDATLSEIEVAWSRAGGDWARLAWFQRSRNDQEIGSVEIPRDTTYEGAGTLRVRAVDRGGNLTESLIPVTFDTVGPDAPATVWAAPLGDAGAEVGWTPSLAGDVLGYLVRRNGRDLNPGNLVEAAVASASDVYQDSDHHQAASAVDTVFESSWWSADHEGPKYFEIAFPSPTVVSRYTLWFAGNSFVGLIYPRDFSLEVLGESGWETVDVQLYWGDSVYRRWVYTKTFPQPIVTTRMRLVATRGQTWPTFMIGAREVSVQGPGVVLGTSFTDSALGAGESSYTVQAQDLVGNRSLDSPPAYIDTLPPRVGLTAPLAGALTNAATRIAGSMEDPNLASWTLAWGYGAEPGAWTTLTYGYRGPFTEYAWNPTGIDADVTVKLAAIDAAGNQGEARTSFHLDAVAPQAPTGLQAAAGEDGVRLTWVPNPETDLAGYLVYRDGKALTTSNVAAFGRPWASSEYVDRTWHYYDTSYTADLAIDGKSAYPGLPWRNDSAVPGPIMWGLDFDEPVTIDGVRAWLWAAYYPPIRVYLEGLVGGAWVVLGTVTDNAEWYRTFSFAPETVSALRLRFPLEDWERPWLGLHEVEVSPAGAEGPVAAAEYLDTFLADPLGTEHRWQVAALDAAGNVGPRSSEALVDFRAPQLAIDAPGEDAVVGARVDVSGTVADNLLSGWTLTGAMAGETAAVVAAGTSAVASAHLGSWGPPSGREGQGVLTLAAVDASGRQSSLERRVHVDTVAPASPGTPSVSEDIDGITVCWNPPPDPDVVGYVLHRNGEPLQASDLAPLGVVISESMLTPERVLDGKPETEAYATGVADGSWWGLSFRTPHAFATLRVVWRSDVYWWHRKLVIPSSILLQVRRGLEWETVRRVVGETADVGEYVFDPPVVGDAIRIRPEVPFAAWRIFDVAVVPEETSPVTGTCYRDRVLEGWSPREAAYTVVAVDHVGNRSEPSGGRLFDAEPPRVALHGPAEGALVPASVPLTGYVRDSLLSQWTVEGALGGGAWQPVASGSEGADGLLGTWEPETGFKGQGKLRLSATDGAGNAGQVEVNVSVDADPPAAPTGLLAVREELSTALRWTAPPDDDLAGYRVYKNGVPLFGEITQLARLSTLTGYPLSRDPSGAIPGSLGGPPTGIEMRFDYRPSVAEVALSFVHGYYYYCPTDLSLESWNGSAWVTVSALTGNTSGDVVFRLDAPTSSDRLRVIVRDKEPSYYQPYLSIASLVVTAAGGSLVAGTSHVVGEVAASQDAFTVTAVDLAGNEGPHCDRAIVDNIPPTAEITTPAPGALVAHGSGVSGSADDPYLDRWTLSWGEGTEPVSWTTVAEGTTYKRQSWFGTLPLPALESEGVLRLEVRDLSGLTSVDEVPFRYDHLPPRASLRIADRYWVPGAEALVEGTLEDANLTSASVTTSWPPTYQQVTLASWADSRSGVLAAVATGALPANENYTLSLRGLDAVGQYGYAGQAVNVAWIDYLGEVGLRGAAGEPIVPSDGVVADGALWVLDAQTRKLHRVGADGIATLSAPDASYSFLAAAPDRLWLFGGYALQPYSFDGFPLGSPTSYPSYSAVDMVVRADGSPVVLEGNKLTLYTPTGTSNGTITLSESGQGIAVDRLGYFYVIGASGAVHVLDPQGQPFSDLPLPGKLTPYQARKIAVDDQGRIALAKSSGPLVVLLAPSGELLTRFGIPGVASQEISDVSGLLVRDGRFLVLDGGNRKVLEFAPLFPEGPLTSPTARIDHPRDGTAVREGVMVTGTAWNDPDTAWTLDVGAGASPATWTPLGAGAGPLQVGRLVPWNTRSYADGPWTLRLTVSGGAGPALEARTTVTVDNRKPVADITSPAEGSLVTGLVAVNGSATDERFASFTLTTLRSGDTQETTVAQGNAPVSSGLLGTWNADAVSAGVYTIILRVTDLAGNVGEDRVTVSVGGVAYSGMLGSGLLTTPVAVTRFADGRWAIADTGARKVLFLAADGSAAGSIAANDLGQALNSLKDVTVSSDGRLVVLDSCRVSIYDSLGAPLGGFGSCGTLAEQVKQPSAVAVDPAGRISVVSSVGYVNEMAYAGYKSFDGTGALVLQRIGYGEDPGLFMNPVGIGVDRSGTTAVVDSGAKRIQLFDRDGNLLRLLPFPPGSASDLAVDPSGRMLVLTGATERLSLVSPDGLVLASWGKYGTAEGLVQAPTDVWLGGGLAAVTDSTKKALLLYDVAALTPAPAANVASLATPAPGSSVAARIRVQGTAAGPDVTGFRVLVAEGADPASWSEGAAGAGQVVDGALALLDLSGMPEGEVTIRLETLGEGGILAATQATCQLDKTPPAVEIVTPVPYGRLGNGEPIAYRVTGDDATFTLTMGRDDASSGSRKVLAAGTGNVDTTATWSPADFPPGVYRVSLVARDEAGNFGIARPLASTGLIRYAGTWDLTSAFGSESPVSLAEDGDNLLLVTSRSVYVLDRGGAVLGKLWPAVSLCGGHSDIAALPGRYVYLSSSCRDLRMYLPDGTLERTIPTTSSYLVNGQNYIETVDAAGRILVSYYNQVRAFSPDGSYLGMYDPGAIRVRQDRAGNLYHARTGPEVRVTTPTGELLSSFGAYGPEPWKFGGLRGLAVDGAGHILVHDGPGGTYETNYKSLLSFWTPDGRYLTHTSGNGYGEGWLGYNASVDMVWGSDGLVYVLSSGKVLVFDPAALLPSQGAPVAAIASPAEGAYVRPTFAVTGTASGGTGYTLRLEGPAYSLDVATGTADVVDGIVGTARCEGAPDGPYDLVLRVDSGTGPVEARHTVFLDSRAPTVALTAPARMSRILGGTPVVGTVQDEHLASWRLEVSTAVNHGVQWATIAEGTGSVDGELAVLDPATIQAGAHTLRLTGTDAAGHRATDEVVVTVGTVPLEAAFRIPNGSPGWAYPLSSIVFLPDGTLLMFGGDGRLHRWDPDGSYLGELLWSRPEGWTAALTIQAIVRAPGGFALLLYASVGGGTYYVAIFEADGSLRTWIAMRGGYGPGLVSSPRPPIVLADRVLVPETESVEAYAFDGTSLGTWGEPGSDPGEFGSISFGLADDQGRVLLWDSTARFLQVYSPDGTWRGRVPLSNGNGGSVYPSHVAVDGRGNIAIIESWRGYLYRSDGALLSTFIPAYSGEPGCLQGTMGVAFDAAGKLWTLDLMGYTSDSDYRVQRFGVDWGSLGASLGPIALYAPAEDGFLPAEGWVQGRATGVEPLTWTLSAGAGAAPAAWQEVAQGAGSLPLGILSRWTAGARPEGTYTLRLTVRDGGGAETEVRRTFTLDVTPPRVDIDQPGDREALEGATAPISGGISDDNPGSYAVKYFGTDKKWWKIAAGTAFPQGSALGTWAVDVLTPDVFRLKAWAVDAANNLSVAARDVTKHPLRFLGDLPGAAVPEELGVGAAARSGTIAVSALPQQNAVRLLRDGRPTVTITVPPDAGTDTFKVEALSFAPEGELVVYGKSQLSSGYIWHGKVLWYAEDGGLLDAFTFPQGQPGSQWSTYGALQALSNRRVAFWVGSPTWQIATYGPAGLLGTIPAPASYWPNGRGDRICLDPDENFVLASNVASAFEVRVVSQDGALVRTIVPPGGWTQTNTFAGLSCDGAGGLFIRDNYGKIRRHAADGTHLWTSGAPGWYPGRHHEYYGQDIVLAGGRGLFATHEHYTGVIHRYEALDEHVDRTPPTLAFAPALGRDFLHDLAEILGTVSDEHLRAWTLSALPGGDPAAAVVVAAGGRASIVDGLLAAWDVTGLDGPWRLVLEADDTSGNTARIELDVTVLNDRVPPVVTADPPGGLYREAQVVTLAADEPATIRVTSDGGAPGLDSPAYAGPIAVGATTTLRWIAIDVAGNVSSEGSATYEIDLVPPAVTVGALADPLRSTDAILVGTVEPGATVAVSAGATATLGAVEYPSAGSWTCAVSGLSAGPVTFTATATDAAGNTAVATVSTTVNLNRAPMLDPIGSKAVDEDALLVFAVTAQDPDGTTPEVTAAGLPPGALFAAGEFSWTPSFDQSGTYVVTFRASDGDLEDLALVTITVTHVNRAPTVPVVHAPRIEGEVAVLTPVLEVESSVDPDGDPLGYEFEIYADGGMTALAGAAAAVPASGGLSSWTVGTALADNSRYWWRARASDGQAVSQWAEGVFFVNTANDPPGALTTSNPPDDAEVTTLSPELRVANSADVDGDALTYAFEVYADAALTTLVATTSLLAPEASGTTGWTVSPELTENSWYWWVATVTDEHGGAASCAPQRFFVNVANETPSVPAVVFPEVGQEVGVTTLSLAVANAADPDFDTLSYTFELDTVSSFDGAGKVSSGAVPEGVGTTAAQVTDLQENTLYHWRVRVDDGLAASGWAAGSFFVNTANEDPSAVSVRNPGAGAWVDSVAPLLEVTAADDPDRDALTYDFEVALPEAPGTPVAAGSSAVPAWTAEPPLTDNTWHLWRSRAVDEHGATGPWTADAAFFVNNNGLDDPPSITITQPAGDVSVPAGAFTIRWADADPDSNAAIALYRDADAAGEDGVLIADGLEEDPDGSDDAFAWDSSQVPAGRYWVYGVITDGTAARASYGLGTVTVDQQAPEASASPAPGMYTASVTVTLGASDDTDGTPVIRYTVDGTAPTLESPVYEGPLTFTSTTELSFFATDAAGRQGAVEGPFLYTIVPAFSTISAAAGPEGSISPAGGVSVPAHGSQTFTITPGTNYRISSVTVDGVEVGAVSSYTFEDVIGPHTIDAAFSRYAAVTLLAPNGGEVLATGSTFTIRWGAPTVAQEFDLSYSTNNGSSYSTIANGRSGYSYTWTVPKLTANSTQCLVRVVGEDDDHDTVGSDTSSGPFAIEVVRLTSPNGGEIFHREATPTVPITWVTNATADTVTKVTLHYSTNGGGTWTKITDLSSNPGTYAWALPGTSSGQYRVKVELFRYSSALGGDSSNADFTVTYP